MPALTLPGSLQILLLVLLVKQVHPEHCNSEQAATMDPQLTATSRQQNTQHPSPAVEELASRALALGSAMQLTECGLGKGVGGHRDLQSVSG